MPEYSGPKPPKMPADYTGLAFIPMTTGKARVYFFEEGKRKGDFDCSPEGLAAMAAEALHLAETMHHLGGNPSVEAKMPAPQGEVIQANRFGLISNPETELKTLVVQVGGAAIGFAIHSKALEALAQAFQEEVTQRGKLN